jgi:hypothetical protein
MMAWVAAAITAVLILLGGCASIKHTEEPWEVACIADCGECDICQLECRVTGQGRDLEEMGIDLPK